MWQDGDAEFIAHAREDLPRLLAAVRAVEAVVNRLGHVDGDVSQPAPSYYVSVGRKVVADEVRRALADALEGER